MKKIPMIFMLCAPYLLFGLYMSENIKALFVGLILFAAVMLFGALYAFFSPANWLWRRTDFVLVYAAEDIEYSSFPFDFCGCIGPFCCNNSLDSATVSF